MTIRSTGTEHGLSAGTRMPADEAQGFLAEASRCLAASLDYQTTLAAVAQLSVPRLADWCLIDIIDDDRRLHRLAIAHRDPGKAAVAEEVRRRHPPNDQGVRGPSRVVRTGRPELVAEVTEEVLAAAVQEPEHRWLLETLGAGSYICVPLTVRGSVLGVMTFIGDAAGRRYTAGDLAVAEDLGKRAALAVDNARLFRRAQDELADRKRVESALRDSEQRSRAVFNHALEAMVLADDQMRYLDANPAACALFGLERDALLERRVSDFAEPDGQADAVAAWQQFLAIGEMTGVFRLRRPDGTTRDVEFSAKANVLPGQHLSVLRDVTDRLRMEQAGRDSEEQYRLLFEANPQPMWVFECDTLRFLAVNDAAVRHYGYTREEFLAMTVRDIRPVEEIPQLMADVREAGTSAPVAIGLLHHRTRDGRIIDVEITRSSIVFQGRPARLILAVDVTQRRRAEQRIKESLEEKEVLLKEIHHRVKNNLQVILSLLELQSVYAHDPEAVALMAESQYRIKSMALIHEALYQTDQLAAIDMRSYVDTLMQHLFKAYGISRERVGPRVDIDQVYLNIDTAIPCGLLINELVSNALKHAFPDQRSGELLVALCPDGPEHYQLTVRDTGVGLPEQIQAGGSQTLGFQLVHALAEQLGGQVKIERKAGTSITVRVSQLQGQRSAKPWPRADTEASLELDPRRKMYAGTRQ